MADSARGERPGEPFPLEVIPMADDTKKPLELDLPVAIPGVSPQGNPGGAMHNGLTLPKNSTAPGNSFAAQQIAENKRRQGR